LNPEIVDISSCKKHLVAEVPAAQVEEEINRMARKFARQAKVPGFRPGKVPLSIIRQRFGDDLRNDVIQEIISRTWKKTVEERTLQPLAEPAVEKVEGEAGQPLKFVLAYEVLPELEVGEYKGLQATISPLVIKDEDVEAALEHLRQDKAQFVPFEDSPVADGHYVTVSLNGEFEGGGRPIHEEAATLVVGAPQTNREFSENLRGCRVDDARAFDVVYPAEYHQKRLAGRTIHYHVKVKEIKEKQVPELNDDFARDIGAASLEELRRKVRDELVTKARQAAEEKAREAVLDQVVRRLSFDVPDIMIREELEEHGRRIASNLARQGIDINKTSIDWKKIFDEERPLAETSVRRRMVLDTIAGRESLEVTEQELDEEFRKLAGPSGKSAAALRAQFEKDQRLQSFRKFLLRHKALDFIYRNATITEG